MRVAVQPDGSAVDQPTFANACMLSGKIATRADLYLAGQFRGSVPITDGSIVLDRSAERYGRLTGMTVDAAPEDLPTRQGGRLTPSGWEVQVWSGLVLSGPPEITAVVPLGIFPFETSQVDAYGAVSVDAYDRSSVVGADLLLDTLVWPGPFTTLEDAVKDLVLRTYPNVTTLFSGATHPCPTISYERDASPWRIIRDAAASVGYFARFDGLGRFQWGPEPDLGTAQTIAYFGDRAGLVDVHASVTSQNVNNAWPVLGTNPAKSDTEIIAIVYDDAPDSQTQWGGTFGRRPKTTTRMELVDSVAKATDAARGIRAAEIGFGVSIVADIVPHYLIEPGDAVYIRRDPTGLDGAAIIDQQTISLAPGIMQLVCRTRQVAT